LRIRRLLLALVPAAAFLVPGAPGFRTRPVRADDGTDLVTCTSMGWSVGVWNPAIKQTQLVPVQEVCPGEEVVLWWTMAKSPIYVYSPYSVGYKLATPPGTSPGSGMLGWYLDGGLWAQSDLRTIPPQLSLDVSDAQSL
jgi:hypothetical protein